MTEVYNDCYFMTFLTGENIWVLLDYLDGKIKEKDNHKKEKAKNLLKLMGKQFYDDVFDIGDMMIDIDQ